MKLPSMYILFKKLAFIVLEMVTILISFFVITMMLWTYLETTHYFERPPHGEEDLGAAMMNGSCVFASLFFTLPFSMWVHSCLLGNFYHRRKKDEKN